MSQGDVIKLLKKNKGKWLSSKEIEKRLKIARSSVSSNLKKLEQQGEILRIVKPPFKSPHLWKINERFFIK